MKKKFSLSIIILSFFTFAKAQKQRSDIYIRVPSSFEFQSEPNQYQLNEMTVFLLEKEGFKAYLEGDTLPQFLRFDPCKSLSAMLLEESTRLRTRLYLILKDCKGNEVFRSAVAENKEKNYLKAYQLAVREIFEVSDFSMVSSDQSAQGQEDNGKSGNTATPLKSELRVRMQEYRDGSMIYLLNTETGIARLFSSPTPDIFIYVSEDGHGVAVKKGNLIRVTFLNHQGQKQNTEYLVQ